MASPESPTVVGGRYRLLQPIGSGGMADVYEARHLMTGRLVAIKYLRNEQTGFAERAGRALQEAAACGAVRHRSVVDVLDAGWTDEDDLFIVFERLYGMTLSELFRTRFVHPTELVSMMLKALSGLSALHDAGWLHLDIKPANILVIDPKAEIEGIRLIDLGIAERHPVAALAEDEPIQGTLQYMSPEQVRGQVLDVRSDLWSLGAVMYRALTGRPPSKPETLEERMAFDREGYWDLATERPDLPLEVIGIVERALQVDVEQRWENARSFASALLSVNEIRLSQVAVDHWPANADL